MDTSSAQTRRGAGGRTAAGTRRSATPKGGLMTSINSGETGRPRKTRRTKFVVFGALVALGFICFQGATDARYPEISATATTISTPTTSTPTTSTPTTTSPTPAGASTSTTTATT